MLISYILIDDTSSKIYTHFPATLSHSRGPIYGIMIIFIIVTGNRQTQAVGLDEAKVSSKLLQPAVIQWS